MYTTHYGFTGDPFRPDPDPHFFFESPGHKRALAYLRYGLTQDAGSVIVTGSRGIGKTTLVRRLARQLTAKSLVAAEIAVPPLGLDSLIAAVTEQLGLPRSDVSFARQLASLKSHLITLRQAGKRTCLVLDEVHHLSPPQLEELEAILDLRTGARRLMPGLLFADASFRDVLRAVERQPLRQATVVAYQVNPFGLEETMAYVEHRLRRVGWQDDPVFLPLAQMELYFLSMGIPGRINELCERTLTLAAEHRLHEVKAETVGTAAASLPPEPESGDGRPW